MGDIWKTMTRSGEIGWMAFVTLFIFIIWMYQVRLLMALFLRITSYNVCYTKLLREMSAPPQALRQPLMVACVR